MSEVEPRDDGLPEGVILPPEGVVRPAEGVVLPAEGVVLPAEGVVRPAEGVVRPPEGVVLPEAPPFGVVLPEAPPLGVLEPDEALGILLGVDVFAADDVGMVTVWVLVWCVWYVTVVEGRPPRTLVSAFMVVNTSCGGRSSEKSLATLGGRLLRLLARLLGRLLMLLPGEIHSNHYRHITQNPYLLAIRINTLN